MRNFLKGEVKANNARGIKVGFKWRKISGIIGGVVGPFNVESLIPLALFALTTPFRKLLHHLLPLHFLEYRLFCSPCSS